jgi:hypothetical protein
VEIRSRLHLSEIIIIDTTSSFVGRKATNGFCSHSQLGLVGFAVVEPASLHRDRPEEGVQHMTI